MKERHLVAPSIVEYAGERETFGVSFHLSMRWYIHVKLFSKGRIWLSCYSMEVYTCPTSTSLLATISSTIFHLWYLRYYSFINLQSFSAFKLDVSLVKQLLTCLTHTFVVIIWLRSFWKKNSNSTTVESTKFRPSRKSKCKARINLNYHLRLRSD